MTKIAEMLAKGIRKKCAGGTTALCYAIQENSLNMYILQSCVGFCGSGPAVLQQTDKNVYDPRFDLLLYWTGTEKYTEDVNLLNVRIKILN